MTEHSTLGQVVWHDLFTPDIEESKRFYGELFGFEYLVEHATDFTWHDGAGDFTLMQANGEAAHSGMVSTPERKRSYWLAYIAVADVDKTAKKAGDVGMSVLRDPFDVPGVGRSCILEDAHGARICPFVASHHYPPPKGVFVWEELMAPELNAVTSIYCNVFDWKTEDDGEASDAHANVFCAVNGDAVAGALKVEKTRSYPAGWHPFLAVENLDIACKKAATLGATMLADPIQLDARRSRQLCTDPLGAVFGLTGAA